MLEKCVTLFCMCEVVIGLFLYQLETQSRSVQRESDCRGRHAEDDLAAYIYPVLSILCTCGTHLDRAAKVQNLHYTKLKLLCCDHHLMHMCMYGISLAVEATFYKILVLNSYMYDKGTLAVLTVIFV